MIAYIKGTIEQIEDQHVVIESMGVGYLIYASAVTINRLPALGQTALLHTYMQVKQDDISLFGFLTQDELKLFRLLISVSGVGVKAGMAVLAYMSPEQAVTAITTKDDIAFTKVSGIGKKVAQRITLELQDKIQKLDLVNLATDTSSALSTTDKQDAIEALLALGYSRSESLKAVLAVAQEDMSTEQIIKLALRKLL
ncbi:MAG: Holliday junction branch migration protein RuvA [Firmicutes bacterium]|nr:Holliday junction branch migration protein RuvA [Bacillota bacterium]